jgi:hypothetical protein
VPASRAQLRAILALQRRILEQGRTQRTLLLRAWRAIRAV